MASTSRSCGLLVAAAVGLACAVHAPPRARPNPCIGRGGCPDNDVAALCQAPSAKPNWPIFHLFDNVTKLADGKQKDSFAAWHPAFPAHLVHTRSQPATPCRAARATPPQLTLVRRRRAEK